MLDFIDTFPRDKIHVSLYEKQVQSITDTFLISIIIRIRLFVFLTTPKYLSVEFVPLLQLDLHPTSSRKLVVPILCSYVDPKLVFLFDSYKVTPKGSYFGSPNFIIKVRFLLCNVYFMEHKDLYCEVLL